MLKKLNPRRNLCFSFIGIVGLLSFFEAPADPKLAVNRFVELFVKGDAKALVKMVDPDIANGKELDSAQVASFLKRYRSRSAKIESVRIGKQVASEDGKTKRFKSALTFVCPALSPKYPDPAKLKMTLLWGMQKNRWWLERPLSIQYVVPSRQSYPTASQDETAMRFSSAVEILTRIGYHGREDLKLIGHISSGSAQSQYKELVDLHQREVTEKGVDYNARGVKLLLKAAARKQGGFLRVFHGDFKSGAKDRRRPVPWDVFRDYAVAAIKLGQSMEKRGNTEGAQKVYRRIISLGRQFLVEPGGYQFVRWGLTFQKIGAMQLAKLLERSNSSEAKPAAVFANLVSRRLDLLRTALSCLDDMANYGSLKAATIASRRTQDPVFMPWGINTLAILAYKGAPADRATSEKVKALVLVSDPIMRKVASTALEDVAARSGGPVAGFVNYQKSWVRNHEVYGTTQSFR
jgi:hypothetical protein